MKRLLLSILTVLLLSSIVSVPAKANAWLVLEGINLGAQGLLKVKEKLTDFNKERKNKKQIENRQKKIVEISDETLEINPSYIKTLSQEEKIKISKSYYKSANKNFKKKNIIRGCTELYQVLVIDISDLKLLKKIKKKVDKYDCTQYDFTTQKTNTDLKVANANKVKTLCVSKSFNADYRFSNTSCKNDEREIQKGSDEYYEAQAFIEIHNSVLTKSKKLKPIKNKIVKKKSEVLLAKGEVRFCSNKTSWSKNAIPSIRSISTISKSYGRCVELNMSSYINEKFDAYFYRKGSWGKTDKELYSLVREALISEFIRNNLDTNKLYQYLPQTKYAYLETKTLVVKKEISKTQKVAKKKKKITQKKNIETLFSQNDNLDFDGTKELWHAIVVHKPKVNIYRSDINSKINTKDKAINNAKSKCWFDPQYTSGDWPSENCIVYYVANNKEFKETYKLDNKTNRLIVKKKLAQEIDFIRKPSTILSKGI